MCGITGVDLVVFNTRIDDMHSDSNQSVQNGYHNYSSGPAVLGASGTTILNKIPGTPHFSGTERKTLFDLSSGFMLFQTYKRTFNKQLVRDVINKSCGGDAADAISCLPPGATLDDIIEKFKWLYGSVESFDTLMQEFYRIVQEKNEKAQTFVLHLERTIKAIKQQHPYAMTEGDGVKYLKD